MMYASKSGFTYLRSGGAAEPSDWLQLVPIARTSSTGTLESELWQRQRERKKETHADGFKKSLMIFGLQFTVIFDVLENKLIQPKLVLKEIRTNDTIPMRGFHGRERPLRRGTGAAGAVVIQVVADDFSYHQIHSITCKSERERERERENYHSSDSALGILQKF
jgi:hypothetical protein